MARLDGHAGGAPSFGSGDAVATGQLFLWSEERGEWVSCPPDEITWLDRRLLSGDEDLTLHRAPRCAGLRYVHHRWELFSRDTTYRVYLAPGAAGTPLTAEAVQRTACQVLPVAPARYEALPVVLAEGSWLVSVGTWVLRLRLPDALLRYVVEKGSITVEGISLTVAGVVGDEVRIAIIPHTYGATNLHTLKVGDGVNIEVDVLAKYADSRGRAVKRELTVGDLIANGY